MRRMDRPHALSMWQDEISLIPRTDTLRTMKAYDRIAHKYFNTL